MKYEFKVVPEEGLVFRTVARTHGEARDAFAARVRICGLRGMEAKIATVTRERVVLYDHAKPAKL